MEEMSKCLKKDRPRKKRFYNDIRQQIEFYLGDVNLSKDRFFNGLLQTSPCIDIDVILNCNKIKKLTCNPNDIVKALKTSEILSVTEDGTKIFRTVPVKPITNADECTIYVEDLPPETDHDWLRSVFKTYGDIVYVSVPRYKQSNKIKGFAFVQFISPECANNALRAFQSANACLSCNITPSDLCSVKTFEGEKDVVVIEHNKTSIEEIKIIPLKKETPTEEESHPEEPQKKKRKTDEKEDPGVVSEQPPEEENTQKDDSSKENENKTEDSEMSKNEGDSENYHEEKHSRKRKRKKNKKHENVQTYGMQILSKQDWKKLRNRYLEEQRKKMHELKEQLRKARLNREQEAQEEVEVKKDEVPLEEARVKFTPGVIIKLTLDQPVTNIKNFKTEVKRYANVEYIDVVEDNLEAYFRCSSNEVANQVIALNKWPNMEILKGDEELHYWEKIKFDRKKKIDEKIRCKTRGKTKLIKKVEAAMVKHIKFSD